jgi:hypothetical protein
MGRRPREGHGSEGDGVGGVVRAGERIMTIEIGVLYTGPMPGDPYDEYETLSPTCLATP